jgi:hypothetical protein
LTAAGAAGTSWSATCKSSDMETPSEYRPNFNPTVDNLFYQQYKV